MNMYKYEECKDCKLKVIKIKSSRKKQIQNQNNQFIVMLCIIVLMFGYLIWQVNNNIKRDIELFTVYKPVLTETADNPIQIYVEDERIDIQASKDANNYKSRELPKEANGKFKTYMNYKKITNKASKQWALQQLAETDEKGFRTFGGKYLIAVGTYYSKDIGTEMRITLDDGKQINAMVGDIKQDAHTDKNNQYITANGNIIEFIVDTDKLDSMTKKLGDISSLGFEGSILMIEEMINNVKKLTAGRVAQYLDISVPTLNNWYKWYNTSEYPKPANVPILPVYTQEGTRRIRYWSPEDIPILLVFKRWVPKGRAGIMGSHNAQYWGERGVRALKNKRDKAIKEENEGL